MSSSESCISKNHSFDTDTQKTFKLFSIRVFSRVHQNHVKTTQTSFNAGTNKHIQIIRIIAFPNEFAIINDFDKNACNTDTHKPRIHQNQCFFMNYQTNNDFSNKENIQHWYQQKNFKSTESMIEKTIIKHWYPKHPSLHNKLFCHALIRINDSKEKRRSTRIHNAHFIGIMFSWMKKKTSVSVISKKNHSTLIPTNIQFNRIIVFINSSEAKQRFCTETKKKHPINQNHCFPKNHQNHWFQTNSHCEKQPNHQNKRFNVFPVKKSLESCFCL